MQTELKLLMTAESALRITANDLGMQLRLTNEQLECARSALRLNVCLQLSVFVNEFLRLSGMEAQLAVSIHHARELEIAALAQRQRDADAVLQESEATDQRDKVGLSAGFLT